MQDCNKVKQGMKVYVSRLGTTDGMFIKQQYLDARKLNAVGNVVGYVPGHGGDVYWVQHEDSSMAAYCYDEFEEVTA